VNSHFRLENFRAQLADGTQLAACQSPERRLSQCQALTIDMVKILRGRATEIQFLVAKGRDTALVLGITGSRRRPSLTLELTRGRQRLAYLLFSDPLLSSAASDGLSGDTSDRATVHKQLHIHQLEGNRSDLLEMRRLLAGKLIGEVHSRVYSKQSLQDLGSQAGLGTQAERD